MIEFIPGDVWSRLKATAKFSRRPASAAVAYFGKGASTLLPLPEGSRLVVDASDHAVKSGQTCPAELKQMVLQKGVRVYSAGNLHAKVFVFGSTAFIGSANVSNNSKNTLIEALVATTDPQVVRAARSFVLGLCLQELGPEELDRLQGLYRPPLFSGNRRGRGPRKERSPALRRLRLVQLVTKPLPEGSESAGEAGTKTAQKRMSRPRRHLLEDFFWSANCPFLPGDTVVQIVKDDSGRRMVHPPGTVVHLRVWRGRARSCTFVYIERPKTRRVEVGRLARKLGRGSGKKLLRGGVASKDFAERLLAAWNS